MFERDYLMRMIAEFIAGMRRAMERANEHHDPLGAAEALDTAIGAVTDLDGAALLSLTPESVAAVLSVSGTDPAAAGAMARSLALAGIYYREAGQDTLGALRLAQAKAVAQAFGHDLTDGDLSAESLARYVTENDEAPRDSSIQ